MMCCGIDINVQTFNNGQQTFLLSEILINTCNYIIIDIESILLD